MITVLYLILVALGSIIILRYILLLFFAEVGRKQDLIKHIYKSGTDFQIAIVIPYLDARKNNAFQELVQALIKQDYPVSRTGIHVVATEDSIFGLPASEDLPPHMKVWTYPAKQGKRGEILSWLIERLLAAGGPSKLFVFLDPDDIVRPDFLRNVTTRAFDCFAMQGYIALKRPPRGIVSSVVALSSRLINRIENAGRYHLGLSSRLLNSGWVVRQELLEMIPFKQGHDLDNLEYSLLLNLNGYRVNWAPNMVVYKDERVNMVGLMQDVAHSVLNRIRLTIQYLPQLIIQGFTRLDFSLFEQSWNVVKPSNFVVGLIGFSGSIILMIHQLFPGSSYYWSIFTLIFWSTQLVSLAVARCSFRDVITFLVFTPLVYAIGLMAFPVFFAGAVLDNILSFRVRPRKPKIGLRFDETSPPKKARSSGLFEDYERKDKRLLPFSDAPHADEPPYFDQDYRHFSGSPSLSDRPDRPLPPPRQSSPYVQPPASYSSLEPDPVYDYPSSPIASSSYGSQPAQNSFVPRETKIVLPITNGQNAVDCVIRTFSDYDDKGHEEHFLVFEYKNLSFTTQKFRILDQAYYELLTKIKSRGFTIISCGSCAYFYRVHGATPSLETGYCLYGKMGQTVDPDQDSVTVVSQACQHHTDMVYREAVVKAWQESIGALSIS